MFRRRKERDAVQNVFSPIERVARDRALQLADDIQALVEELDGRVAALKQELHIVPNEPGDDHA